MNAITDFLSREWDRLEFRPGPRPDRLTCLVRTPRFRASAHVLYFVFCDDSPEPELVAKVPRLADDCEFLDREVANLRRVQASREAGFDSVPRVVSYEKWGGTPVLVETVVRGEIMTPAFVRTRSQACLASGCRWLADFHRATGTGASGSLAGEELELPLDRFEELFARSAEERDLIVQTRELVASLPPAIDLFPVFEHGDFSSPNILVNGTGHVGIVDWELADPRGLPAADLFFFLTYIAFALGRANKTDECLRAFEGAFFGPSPWARRWVGDFAAELKLPAVALKPLFVLCWVRYLVQTVMRVGGEGALAAESGSDLRRWLRRNRFYSLWKHTLVHWNALALSPEPEGS